MSNFTTLYNTGGLPTGTILRGELNDPTWLPMNGGLYLKADYPELDTTDFLTFGNNTVQTATGTQSAASGLIRFFAHNPSYSTLILNNGTTTTNTYLQSSDGGLSWTIRSLPTITDVNVIAYVNNMFIAYGRATSTWTVTTSTDGITWTTAQTVSLGPVANSQLGGIGTVDFIAGLYVLTFLWGFPGSSSGFGGIFTSSSPAGSFAQRGPTIGSSNSFSANSKSFTSNKRRYSLQPTGNLIIASSLTADGFVSQSQLITDDGLNYSGAAYGTSTASPAIGVVNGITDFGFKFTGADIPDAVNQSWLSLSSTSDFANTLGTNHIRLITPTPGNFISGHFRNLYGIGNISSGGGRLYFSESAYIGNVRSVAFPGGLVNSVITPSRLIFLTSADTSIRYLNIDTTRFRLERPFMDGRFVDDAYIKAA